MFRGGGGADTFVAGIGDYYDGGTGSDTVDYSGFTQDIGVRLGATTGQNTNGASTAWVLNIENVVGGSGALEGDDRIIYDPATGALRYDADGFGGATATQFAQLPLGLLDLSAANFTVI